MQKIATFAGSNSLQSINQQLVSYSTSILAEHGSTLLNLIKYPLPVFSLDDFKDKGVPENSANLYAELAKHDAYIIAIPENNRSVSAVFKNTMDWLSVTAKRDNPHVVNVFNGKPVLLLSASPGPAGGATALEHAEAMVTELKGKVFGKFSLGNFYGNVKVDEKGFQITNETIRHELLQLITKFEHSLLLSEVSVA